MYNKDFKFHQQDFAGRKYLEQAYPRADLYFSPMENNDVWDVSGITTSGTKYIGEVKVRETTSTSFDEAFLEVLKYEKLKEIAKANDLNMAYFNFHSDGKLKVYDLSKLPVSDYRIEKKWCPKASAEDRGWVLKDMIMLPISAATQTKVYIK